MLRLAASRGPRLMPSSLGWLSTWVVMGRLHGDEWREAQKAQRHPGGGAGSGTAGASPIWAPKSLVAPSGWAGFGSGFFCHLPVKYSVRNLPRDMSCPTPARRFSWSKGASKVQALCGPSTFTLVDAGKRLCKKEQLK